MTIVEFLEAIASYDGENLEPIKIQLKCNNGLINKEHKGLNPLITALRNKNCTIKLIKLLFLFGANVNYMLINPRINCSFGPLCTALQNIQSVEVIELLLDTWKFPKDACKEHLADMNCIMSCPNSRLKEDLFKLLIDRGQNIDDERKLLLCKALKYCTEAHDIELLLNAGASLNGCMEHVSPFDCATSSTASVLLKADVLEVLIHAGAVMGEATANCFTPLERAVFYRAYETKAIKLLLNLSEADLNKEKGADLLHLAVQNAFCKTSVITLLLDYGAPVNIPNREWIEGNTELHDALATGHNQPSVIDILVKSGSDVNAVNDYGDTPLIIVTKSFSFPMPSSSQQDIATILLRAGARIDAGACDFNDYEDSKCIAYITLIRMWVFSCVNECEDAFEYFKLLVKYLFLQCPELEVHNFLEELCDKNLLKKIDEIECHVSANKFFRGINIFKERLLDFTNDCIYELRLMNMIYVSDDLSLLELISGDSTHNFGKEYSFDKLLRIMSFMEFPIFFDVIACKVDRQTMNTKVQEIQIYAIKNCPSLPCAKKKVILNYETIQRITSFLSDADFLKLIVTFYKLTYPIAIDQDSANFFERKFPSGSVRRFEQSQSLSIKEARERCLSQIPTFFSRIVAIDMQSPQILLCY